MKSHTYAEIYAMTNAELSEILTNDLPYTDSTIEEVGNEIDRRMNKQTADHSAKVTQIKERAYMLTDSQAEWVRDLLSTASDPRTGVMDTTSGGGYKGPKATALFTFLACTAESIAQQQAGKPAILREFE
jgi:hypothetical protein